MKLFLVLALIGILTLSGCVYSRNGIPVLVHDYCSNIGGVADLEIKQFGIFSYSWEPTCNIKEGEHWRTYWIVHHNNVYGLGDEI